MLAHSTTPSRRGVGVILTAAIVALTLTTAWIHFSLGGLLFLLNALGYAGLAVLFVLGAAAPHRLIARYSWFPRVALIGYAMVTIVAWAVMGPYFPLAYFAKAVEVSLIAIIVIDIFRVFGSPAAMARIAIASLRDAIGYLQGSPDRDEAPAA